MLSMLKLLIITLLLSSIVDANNDKKLRDFLEGRFSQNPSLESLHVKILESAPLESLSGWTSYIVEVDAVVKKDKKKIKQRMIYFSNGELITEEFTHLTSGDALRDKVRPTITKEYYKDFNLIFGKKDAKHRVAIFSDPLCPFCKNYVPGAIEFMKAKPEQFAVYYYHLPLQSIHPAAVTVVKAAIAAEIQGRKNVVLDMYKIEIDPQEKDEKKILKAFNDTMKTNISIEDIASSAVLKHFNSDMQMVEDMMVMGTPTMYFDDKLDPTKRKFQKVK